MAGKSCNDLEEPETSSVTVKNGCSEVGGYDCDFVESPADDLLCKICQYPARDPQQTNTCCGQTFCAMCLGKYMDSKILDNKQCPYCKTVPFTFVPDARSKRYVGGLKVFCPRKSLGCTWTGELRSLEEHLVKDIDNKRGCPFTELQCSNGCGVVMQRRLVEGHLKSECELREVKCEYCNTTGSYQWINSSHHEECPKYPVECPNHCEVGHVRRDEIDGHLEECPLAIVECPYAAVGCESVVRRKEEMEHVMGSVGQHMEYNKNKDLQDTKDKLKQSQEMQSQLKTVIAEKERELDEVRKNAEENSNILQKMIQQLKDKLEGTEQSLQHQLKVNTQLQLQVNFHWLFQLNSLSNSGNEVVPVVIKLAEFEKYKNRENTYSTGFYARDEGYKVYLCVYPSGYAGYDNYVTVIVYLMKGDYDGHLTWPVKGTLTVQLLNQLSDDSHSEPVKFQFDGHSKNCQRVTTGTRSNSGLWYFQFIHHNRLSYDADKKCQYLKDDCLFFRICSLQC